MATAKKAKIAETPAGSKAAVNTTIPTAKTNPYKPGHEWNPETKSYDPVTSAEPVKAADVSAKVEGAKVETHAGTVTTKAEAKPKREKKAPKAPISQADRNRGKELRTQAGNPSRDELILVYDGVKNLDSGNWVDREANPALTHAADFQRVLAEKLAGSAPTEKTAAEAYRNLKAEAAQVAAKAAEAAAKAAVPPVEQANG